MANLIKMTIQFRRDTTENWLKYGHVVPVAGEPCYDLNLKTLKIGDGNTPYSDLPVVGGDKIELAADGNSIVLEDNIFKLIGFNAAEANAQPRKNADGKLEWFVPVVTVDALNTKVTELQTAVTSIQELVGKSVEGATPLITRIETLETEMGGVDAQIDAKIQAFAEALTPDSGKVDTLMELIEYIDKHGKDAADMATAITGLMELVGEGSVDERILAATSGKVDKAEGKGLSTNDFTDDLLNKLTGIEEKAQVNTIEKISVGGTILDVLDKTVDIPVAGLDRLGVVKSSTGANKVNISNNGEMSVNKISVNSLYVPIGEEFILDGGGASKNPPVYPTRIGDIGYANMSDAVNDADNGDIVTLQEDVNMGTGDNDHLVVNAENVTIDLGGKMLTANGSNGAIKVEGGVTILDGTGVVSGTLGSDKYSMAVWTDGGKVVINNGTYRNMTDGSERGTDLIYASGNGCIEINGGVFEAAKPEWTLNVKDADYKAGTAKIIVKGGYFKGFDPANNKAEGQGTSFVADGYKSVKQGEYYVVTPV